MLSATQDGLDPHTYVYDSAKPWRLKHEALPAGFFANRLLTRLYEDTTDASAGSVGALTRGTVKGRVAGFALGVSTNPDRDLHHAWQFSNQPRPAALAASANEASADVFTYNYVANSTLMAGYDHGAFSVARDYEPHRDLLTQLESTHGTGSDNIRTRFDYTYDNLGRRLTAKQSGTAFEAYTAGQSYGAVYQVYAYNERGELESANLYAGDTPTTTPASGGQTEGVKPKGSMIYSCAFEREDRGSNRRGQ